MTSNDIVVRCEGLTKTYDEIHALSDLNLTIGRGEVFGYIGHNGAGKTTTIRILAGLLTPTSGKATIAGVDATSGGPQIKQVVGYMPDSFGVYDQMRVWEYLDFFGAAFKIPTRKRRERIEFVLDITESQYMHDRFVDTLSKGMKQRIGIARTLMHDPEVLLLDEPANGLDAQARVQMRNLLRKLAAAGKTLIVSSHILPELAAFSDSIGIIHQGVLRASGPIQKVLSELCRDRVMEVKLLGSLNAAFEMIRSQKGCSCVETDAGESLVRFRFSGDDVALTALLPAMLAAKLPVVTLREVPLSLEEAYLAISGIEDDGDSAERPAPPLPKTKAGSVA